MKKFALLIFLVSVMLINSEIAFCAEANIPAPPAGPENTAVPQDPNYVVMTLDGNDFTIGQAKFFTTQLDYETLKNIADYWLNTQLLYEEAVKRGVDKDAKTKFLADIGYKKAIASAMIEKIQNDVKVSDEDAKKYYDDNKETDSRLREPNYLSFSHITVETLDQAQDVRKRIEKGEEINDLAKELSLAKDAQKGGRAGKFREDTIRSRIGQEFLDTLLNASEGDIIGPVKNKDGKYEVARHEGKRASRILEFDKVKDQIKSTLESKAKKDAVENLINSLHNNAKNRYKKEGILKEEIAKEKIKKSEK